MMTAFIFWGDLPINETLNIKHSGIYNNVCRHESVFPTLSHGYLYIFYEVTNSFEFVWPN